MVCACFHLFFGRTMEDTSVRGSPEYVLRVMRCDLPYRWTVVWVPWQSPPTLGCGAARFSHDTQSQTKTTK